MTLMPSDHTSDFGDACWRIISSGAMNSGVPMNCPLNFSGCGSDAADAGDETADGSAAAEGSVIWRFPW